MFFENISKREVSLFLSASIFGFWLPFPYKSVRMLHIYYVINIKIL